MVRTRFLFKQNDGAASSGQAQSGHGAGWAAADDQIINAAKHCGAGRAFLRLTQRRAGLDGWMENASRLMPAAAHIRCQSWGTKERVIETGPSCWTKR